MNARRMIATLALSSIAVLGVASCSAEQTPEPPTRGEQSETTSPAPVGTPAPEETAEPEPSGAYSISPELAEQTDEFGVTYASFGSEFDISAAKFDLPPESIELWGEERATLANLVAIEAVFRGVYLVSAEDSATGEIVDEFSTLTDMMTPAAAERFTAAVAGEDANNIVYAIAPGSVMAEGYAQYEDTTVTFEAGAFHPEVEWDGVWSSDVVSDAGIYGDDEARFVVNLSFDISYAGTDEDGNAASLIESRDAWVALLPAGTGDGWAVDNWGFAGSVTQG